MNKKINKLLAVSAAFIMSSGIAASLAACGDTEEPPAGGGVQLSAPVISLSNNVVSWSAVEHATGYAVTVGSNPAVTVTQTSYTISVTEAGSYTVSVIATTTEAGYTNSAKSNEVVYTYSGPGVQTQKLAAPVISLTGNTVSWTAVPNATGYKVTVNNGEAVSISELSYTIAATEAGDYTVTVVATSTTAGYTDSDSSNSVTYSYTPAPDATQLAAPVITLSGNTVSWTAVPNATGYAVYIDDATTPVPASGATSHSLADLTEAGDHTVSVVATSSDPHYTASVKSNTVTYTVAAQSTGKLVRLEAVSEGSDVPTKTLYYLDEQATAVDLTGLALKAVYSDDTTRNITVTADNIKGTVDLGTVGVKQVTIAYSEGDRERTKTFSITVKERTAADLIADNITYSSSENEYSSTATRYLVADGEIAGAVDMQGNAVQIVTEGGKSYVAASAFTGSGAKLIKTTGANPVFINVVAAIYISTAEQLRAMNENLDGYYILQNDISLEGSRIANNAVVNWWAKGFTPIGKAPIKGTGGEGDDATLDFTSPDAELTQVGEAFTGTFDGKGHIIDDMLIFFPDEVAWRYTAYYLGMFGYIGNGGVVKNFTLRNANVRGGQCSSLIAGVNLGVIENVVIEDNCKLYVQYAAERGCGYAADYNGGTIKNVVCHTSNFTCVGGAINSGLIQTVIVGAQTSSATNCYLGNSTDLTTTLGAGWIFVDGYGTVLGGEDYGKVIVRPEQVYVGQNFEVKIFGTTASDTVEFLADWTANDDAPSEVPELEIKSFDAATGIYTVGFASDVSSDLFETVKMFKIGVKVGGESGRYIDNFNVTVGTPYVTGISAVATQNIECAQGGSVSLNSVDLTLERSDGTTFTAHPTGITGLDSSTTGEKNVTFVYSDGTNEFTVNGTVTVIASSGTITATVKQGVTKIIVPYVAEVGWSAANVDWSQYLDVSVTGYTVTPKNNLSGNSTFTVSKSGMVSAEFTVEVYLGVGDAASFAAINNNLSGWYILTADIDFEGASTTPIGGIPLRKDDNGTEFNATSPTEVGIPFSGILDGNNKTLSNYYVLEPFAVAWSQDHFGGMFGYIGTTGIVKDFTLAGAKINSVNYSSFIAGYNEGTISGITVNADCTLFANYGAAGAFAFCNAGTISDSVCYVTKFQKTADRVDDNLLAVNNGSGTVTDVEVVAAATPGSSL